MIIIEGQTPLQQFLQNNCNQIDNLNEKGEVDSFYQCPFIFKKLPNGYLQIISRNEEIPKPVLDMTKLIERKNNNQ